MRPIRRLLFATLFVFSVALAQPAADSKVRTWRISFELAFGSSSPYEKRFKPGLYDVPYPTSYKVTRAVLPEIAAKARAMAGLQQVSLYFGPGGYEKYVSPSAQMIVRGTSGQVRVALSLIGYMAQQTEVIASTEDPSGDVPALDVIGFPSTPPAVLEQLHSDWLRLNAKSAKLVGFLPLDGPQGGIRIIDSSRSWSGRDVASFDGLVAAAMKRKVATRRTLVKLLSSKNEWDKNPSGQAYLDDLQRLGRGDLAQRVQQLNTWVERLVNEGYKRYMPTPPVPKSLLEIAGMLPQL